MKRILLDMDGVLVDFVSGVLKKFGRPELMGSWPKGHYDIATMLGFTRESDFWRELERRDDRFWVWLPQTVAGESLIDMLMETECQIYLCSTPAPMWNCASDKIRWASFKHPTIPVILMRDKWLLATPDTLLIDDNEHNCQRFTDHGGHAVLFPQPWNSAPHLLPNKSMMDVQLDAVREGIAAFLKE